MKELISAVIFIVGLYGGTVTLKAIHSSIRQAALEKAHQGLPSLSELNHVLRRERERQRLVDN